MANQRARKKKRSGQVGAQNIVPLRQRRIRHVRGGTEAGVVYQKIHLFKGLQRRVKDIVHILLHAHVAPGAHGLDAILLPKAADERLARIGVAAVMHAQVHAFLRQHAADAAADAFCAPRDYGHLSL